MNLLPFIVMLLLAAGAVFALWVMMLAILLLRPPRMTDGKAVYLLGRLSPADLGMSYRPMEFEIRDEATGGKMKIAAWWIPAERPTGKCVVLLHGRADAKVGAIAWAPMLHRLGVNILVPDLRAHGDSGGKWSTVGFFERHDVDEVLNQAMAQFPDQMKSVVLMGLSMGSGVAIAVAAKRTDIAGVVMDSPYGSHGQITWRHMQLLHLNVWPIYRLAVKLAERIAGCRFDEVSPAELMKTTTCPVLMIDGADDPLLDGAAREVLAAAVEDRKKNGKQTDWWSAPSAGHLEALAADWAEYERVLGKWLDGLG